MAAAMAPHSAISVSVAPKMTGSAFRAWISRGRVKRRPTFQPTKA
jgi:hypothetical protein